MKNNDWKYAKLTKLASKFGGPEEFVETVWVDGYRKGLRRTNNMSLIPLMLTPVIVSLVVSKISKK